MAYKSNCKACDHKHSDYICNWQVHKVGRMKLRPVYSEGLWGISSALHIHGKKDDGSEEIYKQYLNTHKEEVFEYEQEVDCGCKLYIPSDNLEFLEWKYEQSS